MSEELFDVCTPQGVPTGATVPRSQAHREGLWHRSAHLWLVDSRKTRVLLQRRHPDKETDPGRWDIAVAGHLSAGQSPLEAVVREAEEELGLHLDPSTLVFLSATPKEYVEPSFVDREWQHTFAGTWEGALTSLVLQSEEVVEVCWFDLEAYRRLILQGDDAYVDRSTDWAAFEAWWKGSSPL